MAALFSIAWLVLLGSYTAFSRGLTQRDIKVSSGYQNGVYFTNWGIYGRNYQPSDLPASRLTLIFYAFANLDSTGRVYSSDSYADLEKHYPNDSWAETGTNAYGCVKQLFLLKKANRALKVLLSIGGWTFSANFPAVAASALSRQEFARNAVALMADYGFDGVDIDWEYPADDMQAQNFIYLLQAIRSELNSYASQHAPGYCFLLTIASPAGVEKYGKMRLEVMNDIVDYFNLMAYDYSGSWSKVTGHQANLYYNSINPDSTPFSTNGTITDYISKGVKPEKIIMGMPVYGRAFQNTDGLGAPYSGVGSGSWENGIWDYKVLPKPGAEELLDPTADATYSFDSTSRELISYDTANMVQRKVKYLKDNGLGGAVFWEASGDRDDGGSLVQTSFLSLGGSAAMATSENQLDYPKSRYDNIRLRMPN